MEKQNNNRKEVIFIKDSVRDSIHFVKDVNGLESSADLWFSLEKSKSLFENIEKILVGLKEANNLTHIEQLNDFDFKVEYNIFQNKDELSEKAFDNIIKNYEDSLREEKPENIKKDDEHKRVFIMTALSAPKSFEKWFDGFKEGDKFKAHSKEDAQKYLDLECEKAGTHLDEFYKIKSPIAIGLVMLKDKESFSKKDSEPLKKIEVIKEEKDSIKVHEISQKEHNENGDKKSKKKKNR